MWTPSPFSADRGQKNKDSMNSICWFFVSYFTGVTYR